MKRGGVSLQAVLPRVQCLFFAMYTSLEEGFYRRAWSAWQAWVLPHRNLSSLVVKNGACVDWGGHHRWPAIGAVAAVFACALVTRRRPGCSVYSAVCWLVARPHGSLAPTAQGCSAWPDL